jgi:hypothetical protein
MKKDLGNVCLNILANKKKNIMNKLVYPRPIKGTLGIHVMREKQHLKTSLMYSDCWNENFCNENFMEFRRKNIYPINFRLESR